MKNKNNTRFQWKPMLLVVLGLLFWNSSNAQSSNVTRGKSKIGQPCIRRLSMNPMTKFVGFIKDEIGEPMIGATILLGDGKGTTTDIQGRYELEIPVEYKSFELTFSYMGYESQVIEFEKSELYNNHIANVNMVVTNNELTEVLIVGFATRRCQHVITCGRIVSKEIIEIPVVENISKEETEVEFNATVTVFPNPFVERITVELDVPKEDNYLLQLYNAKGQLLWSKSFSWYKGIHQEEMNFKHLSLTAGNYFLRISDGEQNIQTSKMMKID